MIAEIDGTLLSRSLDSLSSPAIEDVSVTTYRVPLEEVLCDAMHGDHTHFELVLCQVTCEDGVQGTGYTYTGGRGGSAIHALIRDELSPLLRGQPSGNVIELNAQMSKDLHYVGRGGLVSFAVSAVDIALWDILCKRADKPLWQFLGAADRTVKAYAGAIDLNFPMDKMLANLDSYLERGFDAVKIKVGQPKLQTDVERVRAARELLGADRRLMVDANYSMSVEHAIKASRSFEPHDIYWFEEPTIPDDYEGYHRISAESGIPLAMGENLHTLYEFGYAIAQAGLKFLQPDASNIGGITNWLKVAEMAQSNGLSICSHGMHELHVSLLAAQPHAGPLEVHSFPIDAYTEHPLRIESGTAAAPDVVGHGVVFDLDKLQEHKAWKD